MLRLTVLLSLIALASSCAPAPNARPATQPLPTPERALKKDIPDNSWVKTFFDGYKVEIHEENGKVREEKRGGLDEFAVENGVSILRAGGLPENDLEVRLWVGFGLYGVDGFILKRDSGKWSAIVLKKMICHLENKGKYELFAPKSGWDAAWQKLVAAGILVLPDSSRLDKYEHGIIDGKGYVVETNSNYLYRTYHYSNPSHVKLKEAEQMVEIGQIIADEFGLESYSMKTGGCNKND